MSTQLEHEYRSHWLLSVKNRPAQGWDEADRVGFYGGGRAVLSRIIDALAQEDDLEPVLLTLNDELQAFGMATLATRKAKDAAA